VDPLAGVLYLVYPGVADWSGEPVSLLQRPVAQRSAAWLCSRGALMSLTNPKALVFYGQYCRQLGKQDNGQVAHFGGQR
jgi:threonine/homoserine/homoserine lactone efflux protein